MTRTFNPYSAYKESGVPWLGEVPAHWEVLPGRACYREKKVPNTGLKETTVLSLSYGQIVVKPPEKLHGLVPASFETYQIVDPGDIIIRPTDLQNDWNSLRFGLSRHRGIITSAYMCFHTQDALTRDYGHLLLHTYDLMKIFYGLGSGLRQNLDWKDFKYLPCLAPPPAEQRAIAAFLAHHDRLTRRYIHAQQRLIKLLTEQKQALIQQAVTRGLPSTSSGQADPDVPLKDSGIAWLGKIPAHWDIVAVRLRYSVELGKMLDTKRITGEYLVPYLRNADVQWDRINTQDLPKMDITPEEYPRYTLLPGDILVCEGGEVGRSAFWNGEIAICGYQKALHRLRPYNPTVDVPRFLYYVMYTVAKRGIFLAGGSENTIAHLTGEKLRRYRFAFPPFDEQNAIVSRLDAAVEKVDDAISRTHRQIALVREYRTRLIADVVTGKLDVRDVVLPLGEEEELFDDADEDFDGEATNADDRDTEEDADADD